MRQRAVAAAEFKNACLRIMESVHASGIPVLVTKRGKPLVRIVPVLEERARVNLDGVITYEAEEIFSTGESFDAAS